jgi:hypothetical protein
MDRTRAAELITQALAAHGHIDHAISANGFATRLAAALDALGLLQYCDVADPVAAPIEPTGAKSPASQGDHYIGRDQLEGSTDVPPIVPWATTRNRIDPVT